MMFQPRLQSPGVRQDWMYYMDEIETTDTGSYTPSEVETMAARWISCHSHGTLDGVFHGKSH